MDPKVLDMLPVLARLYALAPKLILLPTELVGDPAGTADSVSSTAFSLASKRAFI